MFFITKCKLEDESFSSTLLCYHVLIADSISKQISSSTLYSSSCQKQCRPTQPSIPSPWRTLHRGNQFPSTLLPGYLGAVEATHTNLNVGVKGVKRRKRSFSEKWQPGSSGENPRRAEAWGRQWQDQGGSWAGSLWELARQGWDCFPMLTHKLKSWHKRGAYIIPDM